MHYILFLFHLLCNVSLAILSFSCTTYISLDTGWFTSAHTHAAISCISKKHTFESTSSFLAHFLYNLFSFLIPFKIKFLQKGVSIYNFLLPPILPLIHSKQFFSTRTPLKLLLPRSSMNSMLLNGQFSGLILLELSLTFDKIDYYLW